MCCGNKPTSPCDPVVTVVYVWYCCELSFGFSWLRDYLAGSLVCTKTDFTFPKCTPLYLFEDINIDVLVQDTGKFQDIAGIDVMVIDDSDGTKVVVDTVTTSSTGKASFVVDVITGTYTICQTSIPGFGGFPIARATICTISTLIHPNIVVVMRALAAV